MAHMADILSDYMPLKCRRAKKSPEPSSSLAHVRYGLPREPQIPWLRKIPSLVISKVPNMTFRRILRMAKEVPRCISEITSC